MKTSLLKRILCVALTLCVVLGYTEPLALLTGVWAVPEEVTPYYSNDFESVTQLDWTPKNHANATPSADDSAKVYASIEADPKDGTNQVMKLTASDGASHCVGAVRELSATPDIGVLKYKLYLGNNASYLCLPSFRYVANGSQGSWYFSIMANGNKLMLVLCQASAVKQFVYTASEGLSDEWHDITLVQKVANDPKTLDYALYVDGALVTEGQLNAENCTYLSNANLTMSGISWSSYWSAAEAYIDDLCVTEYVAAAGMSLNDGEGGNSADLALGDTLQLYANTAPNNASYASITYQSSNDDVASVDKNGKVIAVGAGNATITATLHTCGLTATNSFTASYEINVKGVEEYYSENFDSITQLDWIPKNHANGTPSDDDLAKVHASIVADPEEKPNQVMKLTASDGASHCVGAVKELASAPDIGVLKYRLYLGNNANYLSLPSFRYVNNGSQGGWYFTIMANGNKLMLVLCQASSVKQFVYTSSEELSDEWHDITLVQKLANDPKTLDYALYVDDVLVTEGQLNEENCSFITGANLSMTGISWSSYWSAAEAYIDDLSVTEYVPATGVSLTDGNGTTSATLTAGDKIQLEAAAAPVYTSCAVITYSSSNDAVATVDANGKVTAVADGTATITATLGNCAIASTESFTATYEIVVKAATAPEYYSEDFEGITELDWIPKNHANATPSADDSAKVYASVVADPKDETNQVMKLTASAGASHCVGAVKELSGQPNVGVLSYKAYLGKNTSYICLPSFRAVSNGSQSGWYFSVMANGNKLMLVLCQNSSAKQFVYTAAEGLSDEWHDITLVQKVVADTSLDYALYVDGTLVAKGQLNADNCTHITNANLAMTGISWNSHWSAAEVYVDDLSVTEFVPTNDIVLQDANEKTSSNLLIGDTLQLYTVASPTNATCTAITYTSSDSKIASVNANGEVTAVTAGKVTITATAENAPFADGSYTASYELSIGGSGTVKYYSEDFNNLVNLDWIPKNHANATPSADDLAKVYASLTADPKNEANQVMKLTASTGASHCVGAVKELSGQPNVGVLSYKVYLGNNTSYICLPSFRSVSNGSQSGWYFSIMANGNKLMLVLCQNSSAKQFEYVAAEGLSDEWHDITLVQKVVADTSLDYALYVDGTLVAKGQLNADNCTYIANANLAMTGISWNSHWSEAEVYVDDMSVTEFVPSDSIVLQDADGNKSGNLETGDTLQLFAITSPANASCAAITYESSNPRIATVSASGEVTAIVAGKSTITATLQNVPFGEGTYSASYELNVGGTDVVQYYSESFDEIEQLDWVPKNHENKTPSADDLAKAYASIVNDPKNSANKVMKLNITDGRSQWVGAAKELTSIPSEGVLSYKVYLGDNTGTVCLPSFRYFSNGSQGGWFFSVMSVDGKLQLALCLTCNVRQIVYTATEALSDEWHDITLAQKVSDDPRTLDYAFYVDGVLVSQGQLNPDNCSYIATANLTMTGLSWSSSWTACEAYIDDINVSCVVPAESFDALEVAEGYSSTIYKGGITNLVPVFSPVNTSFCSVKYTSSNEKVATVDSNGKVTAVGVGTTVIRAEALPVSGVTTGEYKEITITVKEPYFDITEDYEQNKLGSRLWEWEVVNGKECPGEKAIDVTVDPQDSTNNVLTMTVANPGEKSYIVRYKKAFANNLTGTKAVLSYRFNMGYVDSLTYLPNFSDFDNKTPFEIGVKGRTLMIYNPEDKSWPSVAEIGSGEWYDLTIVLDTERNVYDVYLDGQLIHHSDTENDLSGFNGIDWGFYSGKAGINATLSIDDLKVTNFIEASDVAVAQSDMSVAVGGSVPLELVFTPENASYRSATFTSSDEKIATVDMNGVVTGVKAGTATITIVPNSFSWKKLTVNISVEKNIPVTELILNTEEIELPVGGHTFLETSVLPENAKNQKVKFSTQNEDVIYVDEWGEIVALKAGTAQISVTADNGKVEKTVKVTVTEPDIMKTIYVAPDGAGDGEKATTPTTLAKALEIISQIDKSTMTGNIVVSMASGYYQQLKTLELNETHGGNGMYSVIFQAEDGADVTVGGGIQIPGSSFVEVEGKPGVYVAELAEGIQTRQLYISGVRATRARSTQSLMDAELLYDASGTCIGYICDDDGILSKYAQNGNADTLEFLFEEKWRSYRCGVDSITMTGDGRVKIVMEQPGFGYNLAWGDNYIQPACIEYYENGMELLDEPGEWYLDEETNQLYYMPRSFEEMSGVTVTVPVVEDLMSVIGTNYDNMVQNITFQGITFADATWMRPSTEVGHVVAQNNYIQESSHNYMAYAGDANVTVKRANSVSFIGCEFTRLGTTGLKLIEGVQNSQISECNFYEISGGAIQIGDAGYGNSMYSRINEYDPSDIRMLMKNCDVVNNYIHTVATEYRSAAAVGVGQMANAELSYNEIFDIPYSGFHIGFGWNAKFDSIMHNIKVTNNFIHGFMGVGVYDGGAIYTLGNSGGTTSNFNLVAYNYIRNQMNGPAALYPDNGSSYWSWEENVIDLSMIDEWEYVAGAPRWMLANTYANNLRIRNNYTTAPDGEINYLSVYNVTLSGTEIVEDANWSEEALEIINNAGLSTNAADQLCNGQIEVVKSNLPDAETNLILYSGDTFQIELGLADGRDNLLSFENADVIAYEIYDESVATVTDEGLLTAVSSGSTTLCVYVLSNGVLNTIERKVYVDDELAEIVLEDVEENSLTMSASVEYQTKPYGITKYGRHVALTDLSYKTSVEGVLTVDEAGVIVPITDGTTVLTITGSAEGGTVSGDWNIVITPKVDFEVHDAAEIFDSSEDVWVTEYDDKYSDRNVWRVVDGESITSYMKGRKTFSGVKYDNELLTFDLTLGANSTWPSFYIRAQDTETSVATYTTQGFDGYVICMGDKGIQLQRFNGRTRTVIYGVVTGFEMLMGGNIKDHPLADKQTHRVQIGAITVEGMVRLYMKIDDTVIFDYWDTSPDAITEAGYFGIHGASPADGTVKDFFYISKVDVTGLEPPQFTRDTLGNEQYGGDEEEAETVVSDYKMLSDTQTVWNRGNESGAVLTADGNTWKFLGISVNGERLDPKYFSVKSGSTIVSLNADYLESQTDGDYTVTFLYTDGEVSTTLAVAPAAESVEEPIPENTFLWVAVIIAVPVCVVLMAVFVIIAKNKRKVYSDEQTKEQEVN